MKKFGFLWIFSLSLVCAQTVPASSVFDTDAVHEIHLKFSQSDWWQQLVQNYENNADDVPYMSASMGWGDVTFESVGVRLKGNSSYSGATTNKKPFRIKLNSFVKGQKVGGVASFSLSNAWNDPSFVREKPYYEMAAASGLRAPRSNFAALYINDQYWGIYVLTEVVNGDFLTSRFGKGDDGGNLYKGELGGSLTYLGDDPTQYQSVYSKESNEDANDWSDLIALCKLLDQTDPADFPAKIAPILDIDSILTALALDNLTVNLDSYVNMAQNYYIYKEPATSKWVWIPWDPSLAFGALSNGMTAAQMRELALEWTIANGGGTGFPGGGGGFPGGGGGTPGAASNLRPLATKLWQVPQYKARYEQIYANMLNNVFQPDVLIARMTALRAMIRPYVLLDTQKLCTMDQFDAAMTTDLTNVGPATSSGTGGFPGGGPGGNPGGGLGAVPGLDPFIRGRALAVTAYLAGKTPLSASLNATSLLFAQASGGTMPAKQTLNLKLSDATQNMTYSVASTAIWLSANPGTASLPAQITAAVDGTNLAVGTYNANLIFTVPGVTNTPITVPVALVVTQGASLVASPVELMFSGGFAIGGTTTTSQTIQVASTAGATPFTAVFAGGSCGNFVTLSANSGTTPATITATANTANQTSNCSGTITFSGAGVSAAQVSVTSAANGGPGVGQPPVINAVTNAASYATGSIAPGEMLSLFGTGLGLPAFGGPGGGFPGGGGGLPGGGVPANAVQVLFDGMPGTILSSSATQVNAIAPFAIAGKSQTAIQVNLLGQTSPSVQQTVATAAPGVFTTASGRPAGIGDTPVAKGSTISLYMTGAGLLNPAATDGKTAGDATYKIAASVTATIGGQSATVTYAGAAPGAVFGLYQVSVVVPDGIASGSAGLVIKVGDVPSQNGVSIVVQ